MEVTPGYIQTEIGIIPNDWIVTKVASIGDVIRGASPRPKGDKRFYGGSVPRLMVEDVTRDGKVVIPQVDSLTEEGARRSRSCKKGTLTIVCSGTVGVTSFLGVEACIHDGFLALVGIRDSVADDYLYHQLCLLRESFDNSATHGGVFTNLTTTGVKDFVVPLPPTLTEQEAIAEALSDADALIESLEQLIAKKRQIKQGAMQELLTGKRRLPGFSGEWEMRRLGEICEIAMGRTPPRLNAAYWGNGYKWLSIADLKTKVVVDSKEEITPFAAAEMKVIPKGTLLMSFKLSIGRLCFAGCDLFTNEAICSFNKLRGSAEFLYYALSRTDFSFYGKQAVKGYTLNRESLNLVQVLLPSLDEQNAIATVLSDTDTEIAALQFKLTKARQIKQGMMQELLTGRIRLV
jgi:type I restriction enzyme, S subunit